MSKAIESSGICKTFGDRQALKDITFDVNEGEIFGFIGPDGAGKTTLFRIISTLMLPDRGSMTILGLDSTKGYRKLRENIGYMPGSFSLYLDLSVEENLNFYASVFGTTVEENYELIRDIYSHIEPFRKRLAGRLSMTSTSPKRSTISSTRAGMSSGDTLKSLACNSRFWRTVISL